MKRRKIKEKNKRNNKMMVVINKIFNKRIAINKIVNRVSFAFKTNENINREKRRRKLRKNNKTMIKIEQLNFLERL
jgi:hypothetical protein